MDKKIKQMLWELSKNLLEEKYRKGFLMFTDVFETIFTNCEPNIEIYRTQYNELFLKMDMAHDYFSELNDEISSIEQSIDELHTFYRQEAANNGRTEK